MTAVAVFGLGYTGMVSAACLAADGHRVIGVDSNLDKVSAVRGGVSPVVERGLAERVAATVAAGTLTATPDAAEAVAATDVSLVCVGTPSRPDGSVDLSSIQRVCGEIGHALRHQGGYHSVAIRSTMLPGTFASVVQPALEAASGKRAGEGFGACVHPEFLREGNAIDDYYDPVRIVVGARDARSGDLVAGLYGGIGVPIERLSVESAELTKYVDNSWHALKVAFANEIGAISAAFGLDPMQTMRVFAADTKLNLSSAYLTPGFAFGGSCLPKDLRALIHAARARGVAISLLDAVPASNDGRIRSAADTVLSSGMRRIGICGIAFKSGTDDLRESPYLTLAAILLGAGCEVRLFDPGIRPGTITGQNRDFALAQIPGFEDLLVDSFEQLREFAEMVLVGSHPNIGAAPDGQLVLDLGAPRFP